MLFCFAAVTRINIKMWQKTTELCCWPCAHHCAQADVNYATCYILATWGLRPKWGVGVEQKGWARRQETRGGDSLWGVWLLQPPPCNTCVQRHQDTNTEKYRRVGRLGESSQSLEFISFQYTCCCYNTFIPCLFVIKLPFCAKQMNKYIKYDSMQKLLEWIIGSGHKPGSTK